MDLQIRPKKEDWNAPLVCCFCCCLFRGTLCWQRFASTSSINPFLLLHLNDHYIYIYMWMYRHTTGVNWSILLGKLKKVWVCCFNFWPDWCLMHRHFSSVLKNMCNFVVSLGAILLSHWMVIFAVQVFNEIIKILLVKNFMEDSM